MNAEISSTSKVDWTCSGGNPVLVAPGTYDKWVKSVPSNPVAVPATMRLRPIYELIADATKQQLMRAAILTALGVNE